MTVDGKSVEKDASLDPQCQGSYFITRISATQLKKVVRKKEPVYLVHLSHMGVDGNPAENSQLPNAWECMLTEFEDVFPTDQPGLPPDRSDAMEIALEEGAKPVAKPAFRLSPVEMDELKKQLSLLLEKGLIRPSVSPWGAPVLFAPKEDGGLRMSLYYRALDKLTIKNKSPIPRIDEIFDRIQGAQYFTSLVLRSGLFIYERENKPCFSLELSHIQFFNYSLYIVDIFHISCHDISIVSTSLVTRTTHIYSNTMCLALLLIIACVYRHLTVF
jgi:hypothetical protein